MDKNFGILKNNKEEFINRHVENVRKKSSSINAFIVSFFKYLLSTNVEADARIGCKFVKVQFLLWWY